MHNRTIALLEQWHFEHNGTATLVELPWQSIEALLHDGSEDQISEQLQLFFVTGTDVLQPVLI